VLIRPTSAITWLCVCLLELFQAHNRFRFIFLEVAPIGYVLGLLTCSNLPVYMFGEDVRMPKLCYFPCVSKELGFI